MCWSLSGGRPGWTECWDLAPAGRCRRQSCCRRVAAGAQVSALPSCCGRGVLPCCGAWFARAPSCSPVVAAGLVGSARTAGVVVGGVVSWLSAVAVGWPGVSTCCLLRAATKLAWYCCCSAWFCGPQRLALSACACLAAASLSHGRLALPGCRAVGSSCCGCSSGSA